MDDIALGTGIKVIHADDITSLRQQTLTKKRA
jgi:hypothetical protein